jgi:nucleoside 2-deoxyribosyltransferase
VRSTVVVAEITPVNANVFYELGYAHALGKQTILLAERGRTLPFDVSGYRCITTTTPSAERLSFRKASPTT